MLSFIKTPEALRDLNKVISDFFVQMADAELDRMWNEGTLNEERIENFRNHPKYADSCLPFKLSTFASKKQCSI